MHRLAGLRRRFACLGYECLVNAAILLLASFAFHAVVKSAAHPEQLRLAFQIYLLLSLGGYYCWHWRRSGQTLPMKTWRLRLVTTSGQLPGVTRALLRYILAWVSVLCFGLGFLWAFLDADGQFLHDRLLNTRIESTDEP